MPSGATSDSPDQTAGAASTLGLGQIASHRQDWRAAANHFRQVISHHADAVSGHVNLLISQELGEFGRPAHLNSVSKSFG